MLRLYLRAAPLVVCLFVWGCGGAAPPPADDGADTTDATPTEPAEVVGTWERQATYTDGELVGEAPATLIFTDTTFSASAAACSNSGSLTIGEGHLIMTVAESSCPSVIGVGSSLGYDFTVEGDELILTNTDFGAEVREVYLRRE